MHLVSRMLYINLIKLHSSLNPINTEGILDFVLWKIVGLQRSFALLKSLLLYDFVILVKIFNLILHQEFLSTIYMLSLPPPHPHQTHVLLLNPSQCYQKTRCYINFNQFNEPPHSTPLPHDSPHLIQDFYPYISPILLFGRLSFHFPSSPTFPAPLLIYPFSTPTQKNPWKLLWIWETKFCLGLFN